MDTEKGPPPTHFALHGAYPNPSAGSFAVDFDLASDSDVTIEIFDLLGRLLRTTGTESMEAEPRVTVLRTTSRKV